MKGLLLKDWYMMKKYCRSYIVVAAAFIAVSLISNDNLFFIFFLCMICGMIPVNLLAYDERSRWIQYSETMPYTKSEIVSGKYLIGLFSQFAVLTAAGIAQTVKMIMSGKFIPSEFVVFMLLLLVLSMLTSSIALPFIFKLGVEKGRIAYYVMIGFVCGASVIASKLTAGQQISELESGFSSAILIIAGIGIHIISWYISVVFYKRREIQ